MEIPIWVNDPGSLLMTIQFLSPLLLLPFGTENNLLVGTIPFELQELPGLQLLHLEEGVQGARVPL